MNDFLRMCFNIITQIGPYLVVLLLLKYLVNLQQKRAKEREEEQKKGIIRTHYTIKTETVREQVQNRLKQLHFSSRQAFLLPKTVRKATRDSDVKDPDIRVWERCRPGSVQGLSVDVWMFIRHAGGVFMSCFCILSGKKGCFHQKNDLVLSMAIWAYINANSPLSII